MKLIKNGVFIFNKMMYVSDVIMLKSKQIYNFPLKNHLTGHSSIVNRNTHLLSSL